MSGKVLVLMGSASDADTMRETVKVLNEFGVDSTMTVSSAHRSPQRTHDLVAKAEADGYSVIVAGAGAAAHLAGVVASLTVLPVIGVPLSGTPLAGFDALLSTVQMPAGIPVATVAVGKAGAQNAGHLAVQMLALADPSLRDKLKVKRAAMAEAVAEAASKL
jgi:phosphoribosylaminoimidazole carboxylase PurE protein